MNAMNEEKLGDIRNKIKAFDDIFFHPNTSSKFVFASFHYQ